MFVYRQRPVNQVGLQVFTLLGPTLDEDQEAIIFSSLNSFWECGVVLETGLETTELGSLFGSWTWIKGVHRVVGFFETWQIPAGVRFLAQGHTMKGASAMQTHCQARLRFRPNAELKPLSEMERAACKAELQVIKEKKGWEETDRGVTVKEGACDPEESPPSGVSVTPQTTPWQTSNTSSILQDQEVTPSLWKLGSGCREYGQNVGI